MHTRACTHALKGRPREMRTVKPLFRLPRGSSARSIREPEESLNACLLDRGVSRQRIIGHTEKRIIRGVWLGSSAGSSSSLAFALQVGR